MSETLFTSTAHLWAPRARDPNDVTVSQVIEKGAKTAKVALFGIPFDGAVLGRPGARFGPEGIRQQMALLRTWTTAKRTFEFAVADWGNVALARASVPDVHEAVERAALAVLDAGAFPLALGGDHSLTFPLVKAHEGRRSRIGVINLDAHLDVRDVHRGELNSGQSFGRLIDLGLLPGENYVAVGLRDFVNSEHDATKARKAGATLVSAREVREKGVTAVMERAIEVASAGVDGVYLSVDLDVLDQRDAPGVSAPTPGGLTTGDLFSAVRSVANRAPLIGADFVEVAPPLDEGDRTSRATAHAVMHLLAEILRA